MTTETGAPTLSEFLLARIAEDEVWLRASQRQISVPSSPPQDPARMLTDCEAKRRIVEWYAQYVNIPQWTEGPLLPLMALASVYADHPDYRDEWAQ